MVSHEIKAGEVPSWLVLLELQTLNLEKTEILLTAVRD